MANLAQIYDWFMTGKKPTQPQFWASWGSFWNKEESIPQSAISNLSTTLNAKAEKAQFDAHKTAADAHQALFDLKQSLTDKGAQGGYAPLDEFTKLAAEYLNIVDDLVTGGSTALLSAEQGKVLQGKIDAINLILTSDDINLDTVQELVNAIKEVETSLETILVNDLTTGGTTKALTAEMGKSLKALIDGLESSKVSIADLSQDIETDKASTVKAGSVKGIYDWCVGKFKTWILDIETTASVNYTLSIADIKKKTVFTATNPIALNVPTNATVAIAVGTKKSFTVQGTGTVTVQGAGITFIQTNLVFSTGKTFFLEKVDTDTWVVFGDGLLASQVVTLAGSQTITGSKTFQGNIDLVRSSTGTNGRLNIQNYDTSTSYANAAIYGVNFTGAHKWLALEVYGGIGIQTSIANLNAVAGAYYYSSLQNSDGRPHVIHNNHFANNLSNYIEFRKGTSNLSTSPLIASVDSNGGFRSAYVVLKNTTVANLPATPVSGMVAFVTDALTPTYRGIVTGGGSEKCMVTYDGTNWLT